MQVSYSFGSLHVFIDSAKVSLTRVQCQPLNVTVQDLYGKRSQDPYALVYLLADNGSTYFQEGNEKTTTFDKTLDPPFKTKFEFKVCLWSMKRR